MDNVTFIKQVILPSSNNISDPARRTEYIEEVKLFYERNKELSNEDFRRKASEQYSLIINSLALDKQNSYLNKITNMLIFFVVLTIIVLIGALFTLEV